MTLLRDGSLPRGGAWPVPAADPTPTVIRSVDDYVSRPISRAALYRAIERRIGARALVRVKARPAPPAATDPDTPDPDTPDPGAMAELAAFMATLEAPATAP